MTQEKAIVVEQTSEKLLSLSRRQRRLLTTVVLATGDLLVIWLAFWLAYWVRFTVMEYPVALIDPLYYDRTLIFALPISLLLFWIYQLYSPKVLYGGLEEYGRIFNAITTGAVVLIILDFLERPDEGISRGWLILFWLFAGVGLGAHRFVMRRTVYFLRRRGHLLTPAVIVNADVEGLALYDQLCHVQHSGLRVIGFVDDAAPVGSFIKDDMRVLGKIDDLQELVASESIEEVIVASGSLNREQLLNIHRLTTWKPDVKLRLSSGLFEIVSTGLHIKELASVPLIEVNKVRITGLNAILKTVLDYLGSFLIVTLGFPVYLLIAILIRLDSPGPVFYKHRVFGLNGEVFDAFKFRTMHVNSHEILEANPDLKREFQQNFKLKDDPRVTRVGRFLRQSSLDELPQFFNVLLGQMSMVGPRYISPPEREKYGKWDLSLWTVKPGITGLWQVSGRSDVTYDERVRLDMYYIRNWTIWLDLYLLVMTIPAVIKKRGAY